MTSQIQAAKNPMNAKQWLKALFVAGTAFTIHLLVTGVLFVFMCVIVPQYERFFYEQDIVLPAATLWLLQLSFWSLRYWYLYVLLFMAVDGPVALAVQFLPHGISWLKACWFDGYLLASIAFLLFGSIALCIPIAAMFD